MPGFFSAKPKKIFILLGHPDKETLNGALIDAYEKGAREGGHEVRRMNVGDMRFDPILHKGYKVIQPFEPDLVAFQDNVKWADHFVIFYPSWWSTMPALLKGLFDRVWMPGFAYHFHHGGYMWTRMLKGKTSSVFITSDTMPLVQRIIFGDTTNELAKGILWFSGFSVRVKKTGFLKGLKPARAERLKRRFEKYGKDGR